MAAKRRHWKEKDGRFWARVSIPYALRPMFGNKTQLTEPLGGDLRVADRNHPAAVARLLSRLDEARGTLAESAECFEVSAPLRPMTASDQEIAAWTHYTETLTAIEQKRASFPSPAEIAEELERTMQRIESGDADPDRGYTSRFNINTDYELKAGARYFDVNLRTRRLAALRAAIPTSESGLVNAAVHAYVSEHGLAVVPGSADWQQLAHAFTRAEVEALQRSIEFDAGKPGGTPTDPLIHPPVAPPEKTAPVPLRQLFQA